MRFFLPFLLAVASVWGQGGFVPHPFFNHLPQIRAYLSLTDEQVAKMARQIDDFQRWAANRQRRMFEVHLEIAEETAKSPLDPAALGIRYAEVEAIRREIAERNSKLVDENVAVLTDVQKIKLKALEEALKLVGTGNEAQALRLLPDPCGSITAVAVLSVTPPAPGPVSACRYQGATFGGIFSP